MQLRGIEAPAGNIAEDFRQIEVRPRQDCLGLGVTQAAIKFQNLRAGLRKHQTNI